MRTLLLAALAVVLAGLAPAQTASQPARVIVGVPHPNRARGLTQLDPDGRPAGFAIDLLRAAFGRVGYQVEFRSLDSDGNGLAELKSGGCDLLCPLQVADTYMWSVDYSAPIVVCRGAVFARAGTPAPDLPLLRKSRVVVARAGTAHEWCQRNEVPVVHLDALKYAFKALAGGEHDYLVTTQMAGRVEIEKWSLQSLVEFPLPDPQFDEAFAAAFQPGQTQLIADLNRGLAWARESGEHDRLYRVWLQALQPVELPVRLTGATARNILLAAITVLFAATVGVGLLARSLARRRRELERSEARYRLIAESSPALVYQYWVGRDGKRSLVYANPNFSAWKRLFPALDLNRPYEQTIFNDIHHDDRPAYQAATRASRESVARFDVEFRLRDAAGLYRWVHSIATPNPAPDGVLWNGLLLDLTEQRRTADELVRTEHRYREIFECSHDAILVFDPGSAVIVAANERAAELYGYRRDQLVGLSVDRLADEPDELSRRVHELVSSRAHSSFHLRQRGCGGATIEVDISASVIESEGRSLILLLIRDVTDRVRTEARLRETQALLRAAIEGADLATWFIDFSTDEIDADAALLRFFGFDLPPGRYSRFMFLERMEPNDRAAVSAAVAAARDHNARYEVRFRVLRPSGAGDACEIRWLSSRAAVQLDAAGRAVRLVGATLDVTDAHLAEEERKRFEETRAHAARLESLGVLAGGIAHDFNNLLVGILGNASMAQSMLSPDHAAMPILSQLVNAGNRAADLTRQLLAYAGKARLRTEPVDLARVVAEMPGLLGPRLGPSVCLEIEPPAEKIGVVGDLTQIRQAVMNLVVNAADVFADDPGRITVRTTVRELSDEYLNRTPPPTALRPGRYACVEVTDSAGALDPMMVERIFDPFFSTKFTGRGLGLAVVLATMKRHEGAVKVEIERGVETRFVLAFPPGKLPNDNGQPSAARPGLLPGRVLLVDDEAIVRHTVGEVLKISGWEVVAADSGDAAIRQFERNGRFDAAVIDVTMPGMTGLEVGRRLRSVAPALPIVMTSGYTEESVLGGFDDPLIGFVSKPFEVSTLLGAIDSLRLRGVPGAAKESDGARPLYAAERDAPAG
ncbi:MAG: PAS domain S-box protein [Phycisphaerales bacterium]|nr:PAS domain S-box protein [Phycisphaerales bacterium]